MAKKLSQGKHSRDKILDLHFISEGKAGEYGPMRLKHTLAALLLITSRLQRKDITGKAKNERRRMTSLESSRFDTREESPPVSALTRLPVYNINYVFQHINSDR